MKQKLAFTVTGIIIIAASAILLINSYGNFKDQTKQENNNALKANSVLDTPSTKNEDSTSTQIPNKAEVKTKIELVAKNLFVPWAITFTSQDRMLFTERNGKIREIKNSVLNPNPLKVFQNISALSEEGLMGITIDPNYQENKFIYTVYAYPKDNAYAVKVVRLKDNETSLDDEKVILDNIPGSRYHVGGRLKFGPDKKLYLTTGENTNPETTQDKNTLAGKILRMNSDGSVPEDNPFPNSLIYSFGHRNPQGIDWHPVSGLMVETEHGPSGYDGRRGGDEVNIIQKGKNYGWPTISYEQKQDGLLSPNIVYFDSIAPGSGSFYNSSAIPQFQNNYFIGALRGEAIYQVFFDEAGQKILKNEKLEGINFGRIREVIMGPDGALYFSTSNKDGNGKPGSEDDRIYRIIADNIKVENR